MAALEVPHEAKLAYFIFVGLFGVVANIMVIKVFLKKMRSTTNLLFVSISVSDVLLLVTVSISFMGFNSTCDARADHVTFIVCHSLLHFQCISSSVSNWSMTIVAYYRYRCLVQKRGGQKSALSRDPVALLNFFVWFAGVLLMMPYTLFWTIYYIVDIETKERMSLFSESINFIDDFRRVFATYLIPLVLTSFFYSKVLRVISKIRKPQASEESQRKYISATKRRTNILIAIVLCFAVCWLPQPIEPIIARLKGPRNTASLKKSFLATSFAALSCITNPLIYYFFDREFKKEANLSIKRVIGMCFMSKKMEKTSRDKYIESVTNETSV